MKTIDTIEMSDHLDQQVTGLVTCWIIEREDGGVFRFTDATEDLTVDGDLYSSVGAYKRSAIETTSTLSVDNLDVVGIAGDLSLPEQDLRNGLFDNARISIFMAAWSQLVPGKIRLRRGFFGEIQSLPNGTFQVELRGLMQRLSYNYMDMFSATCLYDLGEPACGIVIRPDDVRRNTNYSVGDVVLAAQSTAPRGTRYDVAVGDKSFEELAVNGFAGSFSWYDVGGVPMTTTTSTAVQGANSLTCGAGAGETRQLIELATASPDFPQDVIYDGNAYFSLKGFWQTSGAQARYAVRFLDENLNALSFSNAARSTQRQRFAQTSVSGDFTVSFWIKPDDNSTGGVMAGGIEFGSNTSSSIIYESEEIIIRANPPGGEQNLLRNNSNTGVTKVYIGEWNHVAFSRIGGTTSLYVNFEFIGTSSVWSGPFFWEDLFADNDENSPLVLGDNFVLDDVRLYNVGKTHTQIIDEMVYLPAIDGTLVRWLNFDANTLNDATGNDPNNYGAGAGVSYQFAPIRADGAGALGGIDTGNVTVGGWQYFETAPLRIPSRAVIAQVSLIGTGSAMNFDAIGATLYDPTVDDPKFLPSVCNNVYWECTTAGTTAATYPATFVGGAGATAVDGSVVWTARDAYLRAGRVYDADNRRVFIASIADPRATDAWFDGGSVIFATGENAGVVMEVKTWVNASATVELFLSVPGEIFSGDEFFIYPGCDKSRIACAAIFNNIENFFGFPDVPGQDDFLRYPDSK